MTQSTGWTADQERRLNALKQYGLVAFTPDKPNGRVPREMCWEWRQNVHNGTHPENVLNYTYNQETVRYHLTGTCGHADLIAPLEYTNGRWQPVERGSGGYDRERLGWRYECPGCGKRDIAVREVGWYCRRCQQRLERVRDLKTGELVSRVD